MGNTSLSINLLGSFLNPSSSPTLTSMPCYLDLNMAKDSSTLAWKIPWAEEPGRLQSMGSRRDTTERLSFHFSLSCIGEGNGNPLQCSCLENPRDGGAWWAAVSGVAQSWTRLKRLSSSSSKQCVGHLFTIIGHLVFISSSPVSLLEDPLIFRKILPCF